MKNNKSRGLALAMLLLFTLSNAQHTLTVKVNEPKAIIQPTMWGVFFEDINMGADGGIYAELVKNRSFEFNKPMMGWKILGKPATEGDFTILNRQQQDIANPRFLRVTLHNNTKGSIGLNNEGFRGMGIKNGIRYDFSVVYRQTEPNIKMHIELVNEKGEGIGGASTATGFTGTAWKKQAVGFTATATALKANMNIWFEGDGIIDLDMVSIFPEDTWKKRPGGMRADMIQKLADMKPGFIRFPGGCIVEGFDLLQRYQWKKTIGPVEERQLLINRWNFEFAHRPAPDYFQTFGLGFFEYFQLAEDIGAEPLPILNCGMACQFNSAELVPLEDLDPYVQDALDLIEFANGDVSTKWGKVRSGMGHPAPFNLKLLGVGNENWGPQYLERLKVFTKAIKAKYPAIKLVNSSGTDPNGARFDYLNTELRNMNADIIDEHYYRKPEWFFSNARRYDNYPRNGSKIFGGEYAAQSDKTVSVDNKNCWLTALSEAAFMTGLERNADVVSMASYAPLFAHIDGWQWTPDLIWVNNLQSYGTPDYYVQKLYSLNKGTKVVPITLNNDVVAGQDSLYAAACIDTASNELIIKMVNASGKEQTNTLALEGVKKLASQGSFTVLQSDDLYSVNSFDQPEKVAPKASTIAVKGKKINLTAAPYSFSVFRVKMM
ncbi:MAG TPA: alpha-L-arabinofuranosidase C-terminal domain-containing protein [Chitinophagaceae bacterium]|nr:alpha-L-arabinofuranosidase C-terminal domain-containing protein [Chitinophagaceae bacterium]